MWWELYLGSADNIQRLLPNAVEKSDPLARKQVNIDIEHVREEFIELTFDGIESRRTQKFMRFNMVGLLWLRSTHLFPEPQFHRDLPYHLAGLVDAFE